MEASKVQFSQATRAALNSRPMSSAAKAKLRRERVKDYIRSQPAGAVIKQRDLAIAAGYDKSQGHGWAFIDRMVRNGHITKDISEGAHKPSWTVKGDAQTVKPRESIVKFPEAPTPEVETPEPTTKEPSFHFETDKLEAIAELSAGWATQKAKDFSWLYNSNDLREFIKWLESQNK